MTKRELIEKLASFDDDAEIITFNRTSNRWFKTGGVENYPIKTVSETMKSCGDIGRRQLDRFDSNAITFFF